MTIYSVMDFEVVLNMFKKYVMTALTFCVSGVAIGAFASPALRPEPGKMSARESAIVRKAMQQFVPGLKIELMSPSPLPGFYQIIAGGKLVYVSTDGKYLLNGSVTEIAHRKNLSNQVWAAFRKAELAKVPVAQRIGFAPPHPKYTITVFTDIHCAFCRVLHKRIKDYNRQGIAVQYLAWPRAGVTDLNGQPTKTYKDMVSIWCAANPRKTFTQTINGRAPKSSQCANPVKSEFDLGIRLGIRGTPAVFTGDGALIGGYLPPKRMLQVLHQHNAH